MTTEAGRANNAIEEELDGHARSKGLTLGIRRLADVQPEQVEWVWPGRLPAGKLIIIAGDPGVGKSFLTLDLAARVSCGGVWPDGGQVSQGDVLLVSAEDGVGDTIRPRLDLLGADVTRIHALDLHLTHGDGQEVGLNLKEHLGQIEKHIRNTHAVMVVIDPVLAFTGKADSYKSAEVRGLLAPVAGLADRTGAAIICVMHLNKRSDEGKAIYRVTSSLDFVAAARAAFLVSENPDQPSERFFVPLKANLSAPAVALKYHFTEDGVFAWDGVVEGINAATLLKEPIRDIDGASSLAEAEHFLNTILKAGPQDVKQLQKEAKDMDIRGTTLRRAKVNLGVKADRHTEGNKGEGYWTWALPPQGAQSPSVGSDERLTEELLDSVDTDEHLTSQVQPEANGPVRRSSPTLVDVEHVAPVGHGDEPREERF